MLLTGNSRDTNTRFHSFMIAAATIDQHFRSSRISASLPTEEMRAQRITSKKIGSMGSLLLTPSKLKAIKDAREESERMKLTTIFELLRINPEAVSVIHSK